MAPRCFGRPGRGIHTFLHALIGTDDQVEVGSIAKSAPQDDLALELENGDASAVELHAGGLFLRLELEKDRGSHVDYGRGRSSDVGGGCAAEGVPRLLLSFWLLSFLSLVQQQRAQYAG
jgi:hypothetical protein